MPEVRQGLAEVTADAPAYAAPLAREGGACHWVEVHSGPFGRNGAVDGYVSFRVVDDEVAARANSSNWPGSTP